VATVLSAAVWGFLFIGSDSSINLFTKLHYGTVISAATVLISAFGIIFAFVMGSEQSTRQSRQQLYQKLEIQSIELFRFESGTPDVVANLWFGFTGSEPRESVARYRTREYVCQILNLFEMAVRFQLQGVFPKDVFGSWVIWMWELCNCKVFQEFWTDPEDLPHNYVRDLRFIINKGVKIARECNHTKSEARDEFFRVVSKRLNCSEVEAWFRDQGKKPWSEYCRGLRR
jgi:hypothetical protein